MYSPIIFLATFHPSHAQRIPFGPTILKSLIQTSLELLRPGGYGLVVTEAPFMVQRTLARLSENADRVGTVAYSSIPLSRGLLTTLGIEPYSPLLADLESERMGDPDSFQKRGTYNWGFPIIFRRR